LKAGGEASGARRGDRDVQTNRPRPFRPRPDEPLPVDGLTEDIITALSHISTFWVIARTSTFTYKAKPTDAKRIAKELGVRYVIEGSVRRWGDRLRVTAQLVDAATGHHLWAERYDRPVADLFDIQDEITRSVAASIEMPVFLAEHQAAESRPSIDFKTRDLVARAIGRIYDQTPEALAEASNFVEEAIRIDPLIPRAHQMRGAIFLNRMKLGEIAADPANVGRALELARTALRLAPLDEWAHWLMAGAYAEAGRLEDAVAECERSLEINPNSRWPWVGWENASRPLDGPRKRSTRVGWLCSSQNYWRYSHIATAHFVTADYDVALQESKRVALSQPHMHSAIIWRRRQRPWGKRTRRVGRWSIASPSSRT
jgi:adenylate cyclase